MDNFNVGYAGTSRAKAGASAEQGLASVEKMLIGLEQRLDTNADDVDGWVLLSKSYYHMKRWKEARAAFEKAKALGYAGPWQPLPPIDSSGGQ